LLSLHYSAKLSFRAWLAQSCTIYSFSSTFSSQVHRQPTPKRFGGRFSHRLPSTTWHKFTLRWNLRRLELITTLQVTISPTSHGRLEFGCSSSISLSGSGLDSGLTKSGSENMEKGSHFTSAVLQDGGAADNIAVSLTMRNKTVVVPC
jgi:hypothetical protein